MVIGGRLERAKSKAQQVRCAHLVAGAHDRPEQRLVLAAAGLFVLWPVRAIAALHIGVKGYTDTIRKRPRPFARLLHGGATRALLPTSILEILHFRIVGSLAY
eukprot:9492986-Pyramimonas_sp.AAC.1